MITYSKTDFEYWQNYFEQNKLNRKEPAWELPFNLPAEILKYLIPSLEQFQLGDGGGPASLIAWNAKSFSDSSPQMRKLVDLWFEEEKEHSRLLLKCVDRFGGNPIKSHWSFEIFCFLRKFLGVYFELIILLCTEIVSTIYYRLLHKYTEDTPFREACLLILKDEAGHITFHRSRLVKAGIEGKSNYGWFYKIFMRVSTIMAGSVLWISHGKALEVLGATRQEFYEGINSEVNIFLKKLETEIQNRS